MDYFILTSQKYKRIVWTEAVSRSFTNPDYFICRIYKYAGGINVL
jgi:hypothetical protein